jgi:hypothetical protein
MLKFLVMTGASFAMVTAAAAADLPCARGLTSSPGIEFQNGVGS